MESSILNKRVLIKGKHPWAGHTGETIRIDRTSVGLILVVRLDSGEECGIWSRSELEFLDKPVDEIHPMCQYHIPGGHCKRAGVFSDELDGVPMLVCNRHHGIIQSKNTPPSTDTGA